MGSARDLSSSYNEVLWLFGAICVSIAVGALLATPPGVREVRS